MEMADDTRALLGTIHIFAGLDGSVMNSLASSCRKIQVKAGESVVEQGDVANEMFVIARGRVEVIKHRGTPQETLLGDMGSGDFFGEMCILECMPRAATIRTVEDSEFYVMRNGDMLRMFRHSPEQYAILILNISRDLCRRMRSLHDLICPSAGGSASIEMVRASGRLE